MTDKEKRYKRTLRKRQLICLAIAAVGGLGFLINWKLGNSVDREALRLHRSIASLLSSYGLVKSIFYWSLIGHPERWKERRIQENDERLRSIQNEADGLAGNIFGIVCLAGAFLLAPVNFAAANALFNSFMLYGVILLAVHVWLSRKR